MCKQKLLRTFLYTWCPKGCPLWIPRRLRRQDRPLGAAFKKMVSKIREPTNVKLPATMPSVMFYGSYAKTR
jgi:hypothetical protein